MKHRHADKIMQFARMVEAGHDIETLAQCKLGGDWKWVIPTWDKDAEYRVALAFVEGTPVFEGDKLYFGDIAEITVTGIYEGALIGLGGIFDPIQLSWSKPEEKKNPIADCKCITYKPGMLFTEGDKIFTLVQVDFAPYFVKVYV